MTDFLRVATAEFKSWKASADKALAQVPDADFFTQLDPESNSLAHIVKHVGGNLKSRWTDFLTTDGEKPDRNRDGEFERAAGDTRASVMKLWEDGWERCIDSLESMRPADLDKTVVIRDAKLTAEQAVVRSLAHTANHAGQIIFLSKHLAHATWTTLTVPRKKTT